MARVNKNSQEYKDGYQAALEQLRKIAKGNTSELSNGAGNGNDSLTIPQDAFDKAQQEGRQSGQSGDKNASPQQGQSGQSSSASNSNSRTNPNDASQGIVRPEDCCSNNNGIENTPSTAGGFFDKSDGDKLAQSEGYSKDGGSETSIEQDWKDAALKAVNNIKDTKPGDVWGNLKSTIEGLYKVQNDWKKALKHVVGRSINPEDKRQAYANKNILISQDRIARTDKDKFDNMDYMIALIDSSGSMSDEQLKIILSETYAIALAKKPIKLVTIQCDTKIHEIKEYKNIRDLKNDIVHATVKGRGGTDFKAFWDLLSTDKKYKNRKPDLIMIFTDGYVGQLPRDRRHMNNLVWCIIDNPAFNLKQNESMTKVIHINSKDIK